LIIGRNIKLDKEKGILVIPRHLVFIKFTDIPSTDESEIEKMIRFQVIKEIPYPKEETIISCKNLGSYRDGFSSLMVAIANKHMIQERMREKQLANIKTESIRLHSELLYLFLLERGVVSQDKVNLIIDVGKEHSEIMIIDKTRIKFSRGFKNSERFLEEIDRSVLAYERDKNNPKIGNVIATYPSDVDIEDARPYIKGHFSIPVSFYEYSDDLEKLDLPLEIDLMPKEVTSKNKKLQKKQEALVTFSLIGFIVVLFFIFLSFKMYEKNRFLKMFSLKIDQMQPDIERLDTLLKKTEIVKDHEEKGRFIIEVLKRSYNLIPTDISISGLDYDGGESIFYKGASKDMSFILAFVKRLEKSGYFEKVEVKYATKKKVKGEEFTDFNIQCQLKL